MSVWVRAGRVWAGGAMTALLAGICVGTVLAIPAAPTLNPPLVSGPQVTLSWSAVPGALGYRLSIGLTPGVENLAQVVGPVTYRQFCRPVRGHGLRAGSGH